MVCTCCDNGTFVQTRDPNYSATLCVTCRHDQISHNGVVSCGVSSSWLLAAAIGTLLLSNYLQVHDYKLL